MLRNTHSHDHRIQRVPVIGDHHKGRILTQPFLVVEAHRHQGMKEYLGKHAGDLIKNPAFFRHRFKFLFSHGAFPPRLREWHPPLHQS